MAIHIQSGKNHLDCNFKNSKVQSLPFKIHADCDAPVNNFFNNYVTTNEKGVLEASFRGYPLKGKIISLPEGYRGIVLHESIKPTTDRDERNFYVVNNFKEITYWNWDKTPSKADTISQALEWIDIAEVLHSPITEE